ncbi:MAG: class I SAM-dependent methyltransferase [Actinomycetota bacterium]
MMGAAIDPTSFGAAADDYAAHRAGFPRAVFDRLGAFGVGTAGQTAVDLGTGTGTVARQLAARGCTVTGIDPDPRLMAQGATLAAAEAVDVEWREATAERTGLADDVADVVTAGQCWHWFDRQAAVTEAQRILRPGTGRLVLLYLDWIPLPGNAAAATERLIEAHNPAWIMGGGYGMWPQWVPEIQAGGFGGIETFSFDLDIAYRHEAWRGRIRASAGITVLDDGAKATFDAELASLLTCDFPDDPISVLHRVWVMVASNPA